MGTFLIVFLRFLILALWIVMLGRVIMSWIDPTFSRPLGRFLYSTTEPILAPIRNVLPETGAFDLSPLIVFLVLGVVLRFIL